MEEKIIQFQVEKTRYHFPDKKHYIDIDAGDINLPTRLVESRKQIIEYSEKLSKQYNIEGVNDISKVSTGDIEKDISVLREVDDFIKEKINYILDDENGARNVFGNASCISVTNNGEYYFENFLNALVDVVNAEYDTRIDKVKMRIKTYTDRKGMHPAYKR